MVCGPRQRNKMCVKSYQWLILLSSIYALLFFISFVANSTQLFSSPIKSQGTSVFFYIFPFFSFQLFQSFLQKVSSSWDRCVPLHLPNLPICPSLAPRDRCGMYWPCSDLLSCAVVRGLLPPPFLILFFLCLPIVLPSTCSDPTCLWGERLYLGGGKQIETAGEMIRLKEEELWRGGWKTGQMQWSHTSPGVNTESASE